MAGIFPRNGVTSANTVNAITAPLLASGAAALFYANNCTTRMDPQAGNAIVSEILGVTTAAGVSYDPSRLDNLSTAIAAIIGTRASEVFGPAFVAPVGSPVVVPLSAAHVNAADFTFAPGASTLTALRAGTYRVRAIGAFWLDWDGATGSGSSLAFNVEKNGAPVAGLFGTFTGSAVSPSAVHQHVTGAATITLAAGDVISASALFTSAGVSHVVSLDSLILSRV